MSHAHDRIQRIQMISAPRDEVWAVIGEFGAIADWHPVVASSEIVEVAGETRRHITTEDGAVIVEKLEASGPYWYRYSILDSPLPVEEYRSTISVVEEDEGCHVYWSSDFEPTDPSADDIIAGIYEAGLRALRERFEGK